MVGANPRRIDRGSPVLRGLGLTLIGVASLANAWSVVLLIDDLVHGTNGDDPVPLLATGANIWITNVIIFALWYWELDRGGPAARAAGSDPRPDFLFPQMADDSGHFPRLGAAVHRLRVRVVHQRHRVQPHRHHADVPVGEAGDDAAVRGVAGHRGAGRSPGR